MKNLRNYSRFAALSAAALLIASPILAKSISAAENDAPVTLEQPESAMEESESTLDGDSNAASESKDDKKMETTVKLGQAVWSSNNKELGEVLKVNLDANGQVESIHFDIGSFLGIGGKIVMSEAANFSLNNDRIELKIDAEAAKALPEVKEIASE